jgi:Rhodanese-like domain
MKSMFILLLLSSQILIAQNTEFKPAKVSFEDFKALVAEVEPHRNSRMVDLNAFLAKSKELNVVILDTRSDLRYARKHLKGAIHLAFTDFTEANLLKLIPNRNTEILIYCNNNFENDEIDFTSKTIVPISAENQYQYKAEEKPLTLALNIPTYINLYGYGYRNVFELSELVNINDPRVKFEGTVVKSNNLQIKVPIKNGKK